MLRDLRPLPTGQGRGRLFGRKGNRRVRVGSGAPEPRVRGWTARRSAIERVLLCAGLAAAIGGGFVGLRALLLHGSRFALREVRVSSLRHLDRDALIGRSGLELERSLFAIDLAAAEKRIGREPWLAGVHVRRELPHTLVLDVIEREPRVAVALGSIYLVDDQGEVFKRARGEEASGLPIVTGLARERYLADPARSRAVLRRAIELERIWRQHGAQLPLGELHHDGGHDMAAAFTAYFSRAGHAVGVRLGQPDESTEERLRRLDAVLAALDRDHARGALIHLDQRAQLDRVAVRLASPTNGATGAGISAL